MSRSDTPRAAHFNPSAVSRERGSVVSSRGSTVVPMQNTVSCWSDAVGSFHGNESGWSGVGWGPRWRKGIIAVLTVRTAQGGVTRRFYTQQVCEAIAVTLRPSPPAPPRPGSGGATAEDARRAPPCGRGARRGGNGEGAIEKGCGVKGELVGLKLCINIINIQFED